MRRRVESEPGAGRCCPTWWVAVPERLRGLLPSRLSCFWALHVDRSMSIGPLGGRCDAGPLPVDELVSW